MELRDLPCDGLRPILALLDLESMIGLFCALDHKMQRQMTLSGYAHLHIPRWRTNPGSLRYFLSSVRNVTHLSFDDDVQWKARSLHFLASLNPIILQFGHGFLHESVSHLVASELASNPSSGRLQELFLSPSCLLDFSRLTTRLETLTLDIPIASTEQKTIFAGASLPATLTSLSIVNERIAIPVACIPPGLRILRLQDQFVSLDDIFERLTLLEELHLTVEFAMFNEETAFPASLHTLSQSPPPGRNASLPPHYLPWLPTTLTCLKLENTDIAATLLVGLPPLLRALQLSDEFDTAINGMWEGLYALRSLEELHLKLKMIVSFNVAPISSRLSHVLYFSALSSRLKILRIHCEQCADLSATANVESSALLFLSVRDFNLAQMLHFRALAPKCRLDIRKPVKLASFRDGQVYRQKLNLSTLSPPHLDLTSLANELNGYSAQNNLDWTVQTPVYAGAMAISSTHASLFQSLITQPVRFQLALNDIFMEKKAFPKLESIDMDYTSTTISLWYPPPTVTRLDLHNSKFICEIDRFPPTLTWLRSMATLSTSRSNKLAWPFSKLLHLDTPNWSFNPSVLGNMKVLTFFKARIVHMCDFNVVPFLTSSVTLETRLNMEVSITYHVTGALMPCGETDGVRDVQWDEVCSLTDSILRRHLASPMPLETSNQMTLSGVSESGNTDLIGRVVSSLEVSQSLQPPALICIPESATRAVIQDRRQLALFPKPISGPNGAPSGMKRPLASRLFPQRFNDGDRTKDLPIFPCRNLLVHLDLVNVRIEHRWTSTLPDSLLYLRVSGESICSVYRPPFPPKLETLILDDPTEGHAHELKFKWTDLPSTIRHISLLAPFTSYYLGGDHPHLPLLESAKLRSDVAQDAWVLLSSAAIASGKKKTVSEVHDQGSPSLYCFELVESHGEALKMVESKELSSAVSQKHGSSVLISTPSSRSHVEIQPRT